MDVAGSILELADSLLIPVIGFADTSSWDSDPIICASVPEECRPLSIMPEARSAIVIGIPVQYGAVITAPSLLYHELYKTSNTLLDSFALRFVLLLDRMGYKAIAIPRDGYQGIKSLIRDPSSFFSHKHAAYLAGLGTFGVNNTILTERYGPRIRFTTVLTDAVLPYGSPMDRQLCIECMRCTRECPKGAIGDRIYPDSKIDKVACTANSEELLRKGISPCGRCIAVCPVGMDIMIPPTDKALNNIKKYTV